MAGSEEFERAGFQLLQQRRIVSDSRLRESSLEESEQQLRLGLRVGRVDRSLRMRIADGRLEILRVMIEDFANLRGDRMILRAELGAQAKQGATKHRTAFALHGSLPLCDE